LSEGAEAALAVVVLNWNGAGDTIACLQSLQASTVTPHTIVVDNGSTDDSVRRIRASGLANEVVENPANLGYAGGNNIGIRLAIERGCPAIAVLNNDTLVEEDTFKLLLDPLAGGGHIAVSPVIRYFEQPDRSWFAGGIVDQGWPRHLQPSELADAPDGLRPTGCLTGCCIVAGSDTWQRVGLFDDSYFLIFEDSDWSMRALQSGVALYVVAESSIRHRVSSSFGAGPASRLGSFYFVRNGLRFEARYFRRHLGDFAFEWLVRPAPALARAGRFGELGFRWLGAAAFAIGQEGAAPRLVHAMARRLC
jgi:GT2 family glycosyltransferase